MIYQQLFDRIQEPATVRAALVGAGDFGTAIVTQSLYIPRLEFTAIADLDPENAISAYLRMGHPRERIAVCRDAAAVRAAEAEGRPIVVTDASLVMDLPVHVVITATRVPEAGARYARMAIEHGHHVVLVDKEADTVVAPMLKKLADERGVVFTTDDGDEPGLLMGLVGWARALGMEVLCGGNIDHMLYDPENHRCIKGSEGSGLVFDIAPEDRWALEPIPEGQARRYMDARERIFARLLPDKETGDPVSHMAVATNGTGLMPDRGGVHRPVARLTELAQVLCPVENGGILHDKGVIEQPVVLHEKDGPDGGGGIFVTVTHGDAYSRHIMAYKGLHHNADESSMLIYRPYHLCGAETAMSVLCAGLLGVPTGCQEILPRVDIIAQAKRDFRAGEVIGVAQGTLAFGFSKDFRTVMVPGRPATDDSAIPYFMLYGNVLAVDIPAGTWITRGMVRRPADSALWALREEQDRLFFGS
jgi:predicted homoserine dehydrogenase-like protein